MVDLQILLAKLRIVPEGQKGSFASQPIVALFNPNELKLEAGGWEKDKQGNLISADSSKTLELELLFDTSLLVGSTLNNLLSVAPFPSLSRIGNSGQALQRLAENAQSKKALTDARSTSDVRRYTDRLIALTEAKGDYGNPPRPPRCRVLWGIHGQLIEGVLLKLSIAFTRFSADGTPLRATASCSFEEWQPPETADKAKNLIDDPIRIVRRGETLSSIAAEEYYDPALWRLIADANQLENPRDIFPGQKLTVPPRP